MLKKTITYEDYDGQTRTEDFYFNLTEAELQRYYFEHSNEGMMEYLKSILLTKNTKGMMDFIAEIITISFGVKSEDGKRDFTIYPAATTKIEGWEHAEQKRQLFINDSRSLFNKHNKGDIREMSTDTVRISR